MLVVWSVWLMGSLREQLIKFIWNFKHGGTGNWEEAQILGLCWRPFYNDRWHSLTLLFPVGLQTFTGKNKKVISVLDKLPGECYNTGCKSGGMESGDKCVTLNWEASGSLRVVRSWNKGTAEQLSFQSLFLATKQRERYKPTCPLSPLYFKQMFCT